MNLNIIFENEQFLILDKPSGIVVNKSQTTREETLQDQAAKYFGLKDGDLGIGDRAGIVHRLDKETSGLLLVAKIGKVFDFLQTEFKSREVKKEYIVLVHGALDPISGSINLRIGRIGKFGKFGQVDRRNFSGRETQTDYEVIKRYKFSDTKFEQILQRLALTRSRINYLKRNAYRFSLLKVLPKTGRTHQIRVALKSIGYPVVSDVIYTPSKLLKFDLAFCPRLFLHASFLEFRDPKTHKLLSFKSNLPNDLKTGLSFLTINS